MTRPTDSNEQLLCSFCGKSQRQVKKLIAGPGVYICDECIDLCNEIIDEELTAAPDVRRREPPQAEGDLLGPERVRRRAGEGQAHALRRRLQPLQAHTDRALRRGERRRASEVEHPAARPDRLRQDPARPDAGEDPQRAVRDRRRDGADRSGLRRRGRREHPPEADPGRRLRRQEGGDRDHLHRRGRQDRAQGRQPVDHARRVGRGRAAGAAEDPRGHLCIGAASGRAQAPAPGVPDDRHDEHPLHLRWRVRRPRQGDRASHRPPRRRFRRGHRVDQEQGHRRGVRVGAARGPDAVRADSRVRRAAAGHLGDPPAHARRT